MPTVRRQRTIDAAPEDVWRVVSDPYALPRWWPRVTRVEGASEARWTAVMATERGRSVRADYRLVESRRPRVRAWAQEVGGSPFERILREAVTEAALEPRDDAVQVILTVRQRLRGMARLGSFMVRRATRRVLDEALDGLERACGR
jgi:uncharacterized protein YndB with AHSA1/START domain